MRKIVIVLVLSTLILLSGCTALQSEQKPAEILITQQYTQTELHDTRDGNYGGSVVITELSVDSLEIRTPYETYTVTQDTAKNIYGLEPGDTILVTHNDKIIKEYTIQQTQPTTTESQNIDAGVTFDETDIDSDGIEDDVRVQVVSLSNADYVTIDCNTTDDIKGSLTQVGETYPCSEPTGQIVVTATLGDETKTIQTYTPN